MSELLNLSQDAIYSIIDEICVYDGTTQQSRNEYKEKINFLIKLINQISDEEYLISDLIPSTITAQGLFSNISFIENLIFDKLSEPQENIISIGCNYGEKKNPAFNLAEVVKSGRGRKVKDKKKKKRKTQGTGLYFNSQISFVIKHPDSADKSNNSKGKDIYKIKLFRNGVFQVPGIKNPDMTDLIKPIKILKNYLAQNHKYLSNYQPDAQTSTDTQTNTDTPSTQDTPISTSNIEIMNFTNNMRNYKAVLKNKYYHVYLERLEEIIIREKKDPVNDEFVNYLLRNCKSEQKDNIKSLIGKFNPMNIAEISYNTDRCFCLKIKFYRPSIINPDKKTTMKLLKKGKINFDGGNSEQEIIELYHWIEYIYRKYKDEILIDIRDIVNETDTESDSNVSIYDDNENSRTPSDIIKKYIKRMKKKDQQT
jgi:hypothetical protein